MSRDALVVGLNTYEFEGLQNLRSPAGDAEAIADRLQTSGGFQVWRLPEFVDPFEEARRVARNELVTLAQLETALVQLFKPTGANIPETALFFFSGHGLRKDRGIQEGFLATSDVNPDQGNWGLSLQWLRRLLQESSVRQQIVWLDCCYSGELLNFQEADPGDRGRGGDRCFISASRDYEVAYEATDGDHSVLTSILLAGLDPDRRPDGLVTNFTLTQFIEQSPTLRAATQRPLFSNFGSKIILTGRQTTSQPAVLAGVCPYKGLAYFDCNDADPQYFHGRTTLTDALLEKLRAGNFLAILGASGSGKSSVLRAGLLHQLKLGQRLSGSQHWRIQIFRPGEHPLQALALTFLEPDLSAIDRATQLVKVETLLATGAVGLVHLAKAMPHRLILVVDQFEEAFTLCQDNEERQRFFACLLGALAQASEHLCLIVTMRVDFFGRCLEQDYSGLARQIQTNLVTVTAMNRKELTQAIVEPAKQVGLEVEAELVNQILTDVEASPGSLPLLQYTLTELWKQRSVNWLTLSTYNQLGGVRGTLQKRADQVYAALSSPEQAMTQQIFLALTQLGEGTEDTRRQVLKRDLIASTQTAALVDLVIETLSAERLIVTSELVAKGSQSERVQVVDVAHEALIRHWPRLRQWIEDNRIALKQKRQIEAAAEAWQEQGKPKQIAYLLQGRKLLAAEDFQQEQQARLPLSSLTQEFIQHSQAARRATQIRQGGIIAAILAILLGSGGFAWVQWTRQRYAEIIRDTRTGQVRPELLPIAIDLQREADRLAAQGKVDKALANYRVVLDFTGLLTETAKTSPNFQVDRTKVTQTATSAEAGLVKMIHQYRLPQLKTELQNRQWGQRKDTYDLTEFENRYSPGALRTTFAILNRDLGAKADANDDGQINNPSEADRLPCATLKEIETLWRQATDNRCGWYNRQANRVYGDANCHELDEQTLTQMIFESPYDDVVDRLNQCAIAPQALNANP